MDHLSDDVYARAIAIAERVKAELEPLLVGRPHPGHSCDCGAIKHGVGRVVGISVGGDGDRKYDFGPGDHIHWRARIKDDDREGAHHYTVSLTEFLTETELAELFKRHFAGIPMHVRIGSEYTWMGSAVQYATRGEQ